MVLFVVKPLRALYFVEQKKVLGFFLSLLSACPRNATLQTLSIYFKTLNNRLCHVVEHVRECTKIYFVIQEIIFVSLKKRID